MEKSPLLKLEESIRWWRFRKISPFKYFGINEMPPPGEGVGKT